MHCRRSLLSFCKTLIVVGGVASTTSTARAGPISFSGLVETSSNSHALNHAVSVSLSLGAKMLLHDCEYVRSMQAETKDKAADEQGALFEQSEPDTQEPMSEQTLANYRLSDGQLHSAYSESDARAEDLPQSGALALAISQRVFTISGLPDGFSPAMRSARSHIEDGT